MTQPSSSAYNTWLEELVGPWVPHCPTAHQTVGLLSDKHETLYGGAAGGGKSNWLLMAALQYADVPGYAALLLRRTFPMLSQSGGLIERSKEWLMGTPARWSEGKNRWTFPSGATLSFGHMQHETDKYQYQGGEFQFIGFDELTQFLESQYTYLFSRARRLKGSTLPVRIRTASNPGGVGHDWVKGRFLSSSHNERAFIRARLSDNQFLDTAAYIKAMDGMHPFDKQQLIEGNWDARPPGCRFKREWFEIVDAAPANMRRVRRWDLAATEAKPGADPDWSVGTLMGRASDVFYVEDVVRFRGSPQTVDARVKQTADLDGRSVAVRIEQEPGSSGKIAIRHFRNLLAGFDFRGVTSTGSKVVRSNPLASQAEASNVKLLRGEWVEEWLRELEMFGPECAHDDQVDSADGAMDDLTQGGPSPSDLYGEGGLYANA